MENWYISYKNTVKLLKVQKKINFWIVFQIRGMITYRETALLYDQKQSSESDKQRVASVVAHELAHQWQIQLI